MSSKRPQQLIFWGNYDTGKPRVRLLVKAAEHLGYQITEIHGHVWDGIEDKSQIKGIPAKLKILFTILLAYPRLVYRYLKAPKHTHIIIPYLGLLDIFMLWPFAKLRGSKIHWDMFISLYDSVVNDREMMSKYHPFSLLLFSTEWLACRMADTVFMDTEPHAAYIGKLFNLPCDSVEWVPVGVESRHFPRQQYQNSFEPGNIKVLFYGQFIPLHGVDTILDAAILDKSGHIQWTIVGKGQLSAHIDKRIEQEKIKSITRIDWEPYDKLVNLIHKCDICLGIFGTSQKAQNVIPNKLYQVMAVGKPFITANTVGIQSLGLENNIAILLSKPGDAASLLNKVKTMASRIQQHPHQVFHAALELPIIDARAVSVNLEKVIKTITAH